MNRLSRNQTWLLFFAGILLTVISNIIGHYFEVPDFVDGILLGMGVGMIGLAVTKGTFKV